jgi:hypothetical protein
MYLTSKYKYFLLSFQGQNGIISVVTGCNTRTQLQMQSSKSYLLHICTYDKKSHILITSTELSSSQEATGCTANQEFPNRLWIPRVHYHIHKSLPMIPIMNHINLNILTLTFNIIHPLMSWSFDPSPSGFRSNILYAFIFSYIRDNCPAHLILLNLINLIIWQAEEVMKLLIM